MRCASIENLFGHASGKRPFKSARFCKARLVVVRQQPKKLCLKHFQKHLQYPVDQSGHHGMPLSTGLQHGLFNDNVSAVTFGAAS